MPLRDDIVITGADETIKALNAFAEEFGGSKSRRLVAGALAKASTPAVRAIRLTAPRGTEFKKSYKGNVLEPGFLKKAIRKRRGTDKKTGQQYSEIGVLPEAFYGVTFLPFGIAGTGKTTPRRWFKQVFHRKKPEMVSVYNTTLRQAIVRTANRLRAKYSGR